MNIEYEPQDDLKIIAYNIRTRRKELGLKQEEVGKIAGMSAANYSEIERGKRNITIATLAYIAFALNVKADYLLSGTSFSDYLIGESPDKRFKHTQDFLRKYGIDASIHATFKDSISDNVPVTLKVFDLANYVEIPWEYEATKEITLTLKEIENGIKEAKADTDNFYELSQKEYLKQRLQDLIIVTPMIKKMLQRIPDLYMNKPTPPDETPTSINYSNPDTPADTDNKE